jgi:acyl-CoA reductase-like NAD-dependent aldehyde dehydrogenase
MAATDLHNFIDGASSATSNGERLDVLDPATGELLGRVPLSGAEEVDRAVA